MIYANGFRDFLEQDRLANPRRRDDKPALSAPKRRQQIYRARADGVRLGVLQNNPALWKLRRELVKVRRLRPILDRLAFDTCDSVERKELLTLRWYSNSPGDLLARPQPVLSNT